MAEELELLRAIYGEDLTEEEHSVSVLIEPAAEGSLSKFVHATVQVEFPDYKLKVKNSQGLDDSQLAELSVKLSHKLEELLQELSDSVLFSFFEYAKEALTWINDNLSDQCNVCLHDLGKDSAKFCRIPKCYHRFHKNCLDTWWFTYKNSVSCTVCRQTVPETEAKKLVR